MRLLIYGSANYAETVADLAVDCGHEVVGMVDDEGTSAAVLGRFSDVVGAHRDCGLVMGIGYKDLPARWRAWQRVRAGSLATPSLVHPRAYVARTAVLGLGCVVMAGATVDRSARLGEASVMWPGACVSHDTEVGPNCFISPNATLCGFVRVGAHTFIGAGAAVADYCELPEASRIRMLERYTLDRKT
jgi:sugar O-acyltransferase (sialic acid O-acetyltransferase NeuD family)